MEQTIPPRLTKLKLFNKAKGGQTMHHRDDASGFKRIPPQPAAAPAVKHDGEKPALQYVPRIAMEEMGKAFGYGAKKYGGWNYKNGLARTRCLGAALRHIFAYLSGETYDPESGANHLGHAMASIAMCLDMPDELDDRPSQNKPK
jgi:Domain of unknown function (DUF5664)